MDHFVVFGFLNILFYLGIIGFALYFLITILNRTKERNEYLKEILEELRRK